MEFSKPKGFILLETVIAMSILLVLVKGVVEVMGQSLDFRLGLSSRMEQTARLNRTLSLIHKDLTHAFLVPSQDTLRAAGQKRTLFRLDSVNGFPRLWITHHGRLVKNAHESDTSLVVYELRLAKGRPGHRDLYRGEFSKIPSEFRETPPMALFAKDIDRWKISYWNGESWLEGSSWDSQEGDTENLMPSMVRIEITALLEDEEPGEGAGKTWSTTVVLPGALDLRELKKPSTSYRWDEDL